MAHVIRLNSDMHSVVSWDWPTLLVWSSPILVAAITACMLGEIGWLGLPKLSWAFLTEAPKDAGRAGGIAPVLVSTVLIVGICLAAALPIALGTAVLIAEYIAARRLLARAMHTALDTLAAVPSIIFGIFGYVFFAQVLNFGFSILSGGLTLAVMILPVLVSSIEQSLRAVPIDLRLGGAALGMTQVEIIGRILLPVATPGILAGALLGLGRALAETAALIFTSGYVARMPESLLDSGRTLSIHIFDLSMNVPGGGEAAASTTVLLVVFLLLVNGVLLWVVKFCRKSVGMSPTLHIE